MTQTILNSIQAPLLLDLGAVQIKPQVENGFLRSLGSVKVDGVALRDSDTRWLPWFDSYEGEVFRRFEMLGVETRGATTRLRTRGLSDPDALFRERRDSSGDVCFRSASWDAEPIEVTFDICFQAASATVDGRSFSGFRTWYEYEGEVPIHRLVDRQTWELGGAVDGNTVVCRNWLTPPAMQLSTETAYSTVGLDKWAQLLPGALWGRWSLLPSFDLQYGPDGVMVAWFDEVSLIRTVIESNVGESQLRVLDMHLFEQGQKIATNPKTVLFCSDELDEVDALNLWTRVHDLEATKARSNFRLPSEEPPALIFSENVWKGIRFDSSYEHVMEVASEFSADYVFIDPVWEHHQALNETLDEFIPAEQQKNTIFEKFGRFNMCATLDFEVADILGGEDGLKRLCERAGERNLKLISWMAIHASPFSAGKLHKWGHGENGIFAAKESGRHPDTGYTNACWPLNLNAPLRDKLTQQLLGVCERTGLSGYLWDSFCNLGWWHVDYSMGTMRPQFDHMGEMYRALSSAGLYLMPEAIVSFSNHSCIGLHGGNVYADDLLAYSYNTNIGLHGTKVYSVNEYVLGKRDVDELFRFFAHKRIPTLDFHRVPRETWDAKSVERLKELFALYRSTRDDMEKRTVLKDGRGVLWESQGGERIFWSFRTQSLGELNLDVETANEALTGEAITGPTLEASRVYRLS